MSEVENKVPVTEDDLLKSIKALEGKKEEPAKEPEPKIETVTLKKSIDVVREGLSPEAAAAIEISPVLREVTSKLSKHVDDSLEALGKSLAGAAERDLAFAGVVTSLVKSIDALSAKVEEMGKGVIAAPKTLTAKPEEILAKSVAPNGQEPAPKTVDANILRKQVTDGLEVLAKKYTPGSHESMRYVQAAAAYEATGKINDAVLAEVHALYRK